MGRSIIPAPGSSANAYPDLIDDRAVQPCEPPDRYRDRLYKYIPAEVIAFYLGLNAIIASASDVPRPVHWFIFLAGLAATPYYLRVVQKVVSPRQLLISTLAFLVWAFALGGPFAALASYKPIYGAVLLPVFTFFVAGISLPQAAPAGAPRPPL